MRISGVPERRANIEQNQALLSVPNDRVFFDDQHIGVVSIARQVYLYPASASHILVLQDDVELCNGFLDICSRMIKAHPEKIISLFPYQFQKRIKNMKVLMSPYIQTNVLSGCAVIMPSEYAEPCFDSFPPETEQDDTCIFNWARSRRIKVITTIPSTVQHIGDSSIINPNKPVRRTVYYNENPEADWDSRLVTHWRAIHA